MSAPLTPETALARGEAFLSELGRAPERHAAAAALEPSVATLREALAAQHATALALGQALEERDEADAALDRLVDELSLAALEAARSDVRNAVFHSLFPDGPQAITAVPLEEELQAVHRLADALAGHPLESRFGARLATRLRAAESADRTLSSRLDAEASAHARARRAEAVLLRQLRVAESLAAHLPALSPAARAPAVARPTPSLKARPAPRPLPAAQAKPTPSLKPKPKAPATPAPKPKGTAKPAPKAKPGPVAKAKRPKPKGR